MNYSYKKGLYERNFNLFFNEFALFPQRKTQDLNFYPAFFIFLIVKFLSNFYLKRLISCKSAARNILIRLQTEHLRQKFTKSKHPVFFF